MRNLKKFLALVMAMVMAMSLMVTANAAVTSNVSYPDSGSADAAFEEAITVLSGMGVFSGDNGEFYPTRNVTRAEAAALIYRLATGDVTDSQADLYAKYGNFDDVKQDAWYAGYVGYCANAGYIKGRPGNVFDPSGSVTGYEILAMILRVVGYDKNGEFTGADWQVNVSALSQSLGVIDNVNSTQYGGTLYQAAQRQVVADLLFQTDAYIPQVVYTVAFGYQQTGMSGGVVGTSTNPTLGYKVFGLTSNYGVVVGNEVTGETAGTTKIGFSLSSARTASEVIGSWSGDQSDVNAVWGNINTNQTSFVTAIDNNLTINYRTNTKDAQGNDIADNYTSAYNYLSDTTNVLPGNVTRTFKWDSDLRLFNHAVKVWYDNRSSQYETVGNGANGTAQFTTNLNTYAVFDKVVSTAIVTTADLTSDASDAADMSLTSTPGATGKLYRVVTATRNGRANNWNAPAMRVRGGTASFADHAYFNYAFTRMSSANFNDDGTGSAESPVLMNNATTKWPLYLLISNTEGNVLDVVISLDMTMTQIVQANNTTDPLSVGVLAANENGATAAASNNYFGVDHDYGLLVNSTQGATTNYVSLAQKNLKNSPNIALGTKVAAIEITGTAAGGVDQGTATVTPDANAVGTALHGYAQNRLGTGSSTYYYQLTENKIHETATVIKVDYATQDVTLSDGRVLHQSVFAEDTDATFTVRIEGSTDTTQAENILTAGRSYTFTLDEQGNYIYWDYPSGQSTFIYGTYIDFTSKVASSSFDYPLVYVSANGDAKQTVNVTSVSDGTITPDGTLGREVYNALQLPKRDNSDNTAGTAGFVKGRYVGYALNSDGKLVAVTDSNSQDTGFLMADTNNFGGSSVSINNTDVAITAKAVDSSNRLYLTNNTQFFLVDGAGTDNQTVEKYQGLAGLMEGMESVLIDGVSPLSGGKYINPLNDPYQMIYYQAGDFNYAQSYEPSAQEIKTVFIPRECVTFNRAADASLFFIGNSDSTLVSAVSAHATQYTMYKDGVEGSYWIAGWENEANTAAWCIDQNDDNVFYNLVDTGKKAADGNPIYTIRAVANADNKIIGQYFYGTVDAAGDFTNDLRVTTNPGSGKTAGYFATTYSSQVAYISDITAPNTDELYNVGNARVTNLNNGYTINSLTDLNNASSLINNLGVKVSCILNSADSTHHTVSFIYVNY